LTPVGRPNRLIIPEWCGLKRWDKPRQRDVMQPGTLIVIFLMRPSSATATQLDCKTLAFFYCDRLARRVVRIAHLQTAFGSTVRACRRRVAHHVRHRSRFLNHACPIDTYAHHHG
jgi:hypothetical protein